MTRTASLAVALSLLTACDPYPFSDRNDPPREDVDRDTDPDTQAPCEPSAEVCDGQDNDCDGYVDEDVYDAPTFFADTDGDGFGDGASSVQACEAPEGFVAGDADCDDTRVDVHPGRVDTCDGVDNDCDPTSGLVTLFVDEVEAVDLSPRFAAGTASSPTLVVLDQPGQLSICEGTWFVRLDVQDEVAIRGFAGSADTVLDAAGSGTVVTLGAGLEVGLAGLTLTGGQGREDQACPGGGLCQSGGSLVGEDLVIRDNVTSGEGGGFAMNGGEAVLTDVIVADNVAAARGGGIRVRPNGRLTLTDARIERNRGTDGGGFFQLGGGSGTRMERVVIAANEASDDGGGIAVDNGRITVIDAQILDNVAAASGGGVVAFGVARPGVYDQVVFSGNEAKRGGALLVRRETALIGSQVFANSTTNANSAAIEVLGGSLTLEDVDFQVDGGEANVSADLRAGPDRLELGQGVNDRCTATGCASQLGE